MTRTGFVGCKSTKKNNTPVFFLTIIIKKIILFNKIKYKIAIYGIVGMKF